MKRRDLLKAAAALVPAISFLKARRPAPESDVIASYANLPWKVWESDRLFVNAYRVHAVHSSTGTMSGEMFVDIPPHWAVRGWNGNHVYLGQVKPVVPQAIKRPVNTNPHHGFDVVVRDEIRHYIYHEKLADDKAVAFWKDALHHGKVVELCAIPHPISIGPSAEYFGRHYLGFPKGIYDSSRFAESCRSRTLGPALSASC